MANTTCMICTELLISDLSYINTCGHVYHSKCIESWFNVNRTCCVCKNTSSNSIKLIPLNFNISDDIENFINRLCQEYHIDDNIMPPISIADLYQLKDQNNIDNEDQLYQQNLYYKYKLEYDNIKKENDVNKMKLKNIQKILYKSRFK